MLEQPTLKNISPLEVRDMSTSGILKRKMLRKLRNVLVGVGISTVVGAAAAHYVQSYERVLTGYAPQVTQQKNEENPIVEKGFWEKAYESIKDGIKTTDTYQSLASKYDALLKVVDDITYWGTFLLASLTMLQCLSFLSRSWKELHGGMDPDLVENQRRIALAVQLIQKELQVLEEGKKLTSGQMEMKMGYLKKEIDDLRRMIE